MLRHVYFPLLRAGTPKFYAGGRAGVMTMAGAGGARSKGCAAERGRRAGAGAGCFLHPDTATPLGPPAGLAVFFISAVFHEILVGVPLHMLRLWAFWGLMAQASTHSWQGGDGGVEVCTGVLLLLLGERSAAPALARALRTPSVCLTTVASPPPPPPPRDPPCRSPS